MRPTANRPILLAALAVAIAAMACGELERDNPMDPAVNGGLTLRDQLIGSWSRIEMLANEVYTFKVDGRAQLQSYSSPSGGEIDRNAAFPATRVRVYEGTFSLVGNQLEISFTKASSNDPDDQVSPPATRKQVTISISRNTLTFDEPGGKVHYTSGT